jgi:AcrR family transcriptional regulator
MGIPHQRARSRNGAGLPAVTAERIVAEAVALTAEAGLDNWTLRQLAARIEASPAVVYHHVGDREAVVRLVLDHVVRQLTVPPETLPWREWFGLLLDDHRDVLRRYPGVAYRLAMHGPPVSCGGPIIDMGVRLLQEAGFGQDSVLAYNVVMTTACQYISLEDDQRRIAAMRSSQADDYQAFRDRADLPGLAAVGEFVATLAGDRDRIAGFFTDLFQYAVQRCLDGMEQRLGRLREWDNTP